MSLTPTSRNPWRWIAISAILALVAAGGWVAGARFGQPGAAQAAAGFDIGVADTPKPTGQVREFLLVAKEAPHEIAPGISVPAITYNGQVPGPLIRVTEGDTLRVTIKNELSKDTAIHWHGLHVPNDMDGVPPLTQPAIKPGESFTYEFTASHAGTFMYHSHQNAVAQIDRGLYGVLIIDPATPPPTRFDKEFTMMLSAWDTNAAQTTEHAMDGSGGMTGSGSAASDQAGMGAMNMNYNYFTINGKAFPANEAWTVKQGDLVRVRMINISNLNHPMHLHGGDFTVIAKDGEPIRPEQQQKMNTLSIDPGEIYDIAFRADNPGTWVFHCHELHHTENDGIEPGGLIQVIQYEGFAPPNSGDAPTAMPADMPGMQH
jgi:manganese oxidase